MSLSPTTAPWVTHSPHHTVLEICFTAQTASGSQATFAIIDHTTGVLFLDAQEPINVHLGQTAHIPIQDEDGHSSPAVLRVWVQVQHQRTQFLIIRPGPGRMLRNDEDFAIPVINLEHASVPASITMPLNNAGSLDVTVKETTPSRVLHATTATAFPFDSTLRTLVGDIASSKSGFTFRIHLPIPHGNAADAVPVHADEALVFVQVLPHKPWPLGPVLLYNGFWTSSPSHPPTLVQWDGLESAPTAVNVTLISTTSTKVLGRATVQLDGIATFRKLQCQDIAEGGSLELFASLAQPSLLHSFEDILKDASGSPLEITTALALAFDDTNCVTSVYNALMARLSQTLSFEMLERCMAHVLSIAERDPGDPVFRSAGMHILSNAFLRAPRDGKTAPFFLSTWKTLLSRAMRVLVLDTSPTTSSWCWSALSRAWVACAPHIATADLETFLLHHTTPSETALAVLAFVLNTTSGRAEQVLPLLLRAQARMLSKDAVGHKSDGFAALVQVVFVDRILITALASRADLQFDTFRIALGDNIPSSHLGTFLGVLAERGNLRPLLLSLGAADRLAAARVISHSAATCARQSPGGAFSAWNRAMRVLVDVLLETDLAALPEQNDLWISLLVACAAVECLETGFDTLVGRRIGSFPAGVATPATSSLFLHGVISGNHKYANSLLQLAARSSGAVSSTAVLCVLDAGRALLIPSLGAADTAPPLEPFASRSSWISMDAMNAFLAAVDAQSALKGADLGVAFGNLVEVWLLMMVIRQPFGTPPPVPPPAEVPHQEEDDALLLLRSAEVVPRDRNVEGEIIGALARLESLLRECCKQQNVPQVLTDRLIDEADVFREERKLRVM